MECFCIHLWPITSSWTASVFCINKYILVVVNLLILLSEMLFSQCLYFASLPAVILEKQIRIPRSLSVKAASVLKGFLNKVRWGQTGSRRFLPAQGNHFFTAVVGLGLHLSLVFIFNPPPMSFHLSTKPQLPLSHWFLCPSHISFQTSVLLPSTLLSRSLTFLLIPPATSAHSFSPYSHLYTPTRIPRSVWAATLRPASLTSWVIRSFETSTGTLWVTRFSFFPFFDLPSQLRDFHHELKMEKKNHYLQVKMNPSIDSVWKRKAQNCCQTVEGQI